MKTCVFDIEADGLNPTKIHCLVASIYSNGQWRQKTTTNYDEMRKFFKGADVIIGHNIYRWDIPVVERLLEIKVSATIVDTLALSWYLYPEGVDGKKKHGLADWGEYFGIPKPEIDDWENLPIEEYIRRCEEDVKINCNLWDKQKEDLHTVYEDEEREQKLIEYLMFKMDCAREAEKSKWKLDVERCVEALERLEAEKELKVDELSEAMPEVIKMKTVNKPSEMYLKGKTYKKPKNFKLKDGSLSNSAQRFIAACEQAGEDYRELDEVYLPSKELSSRAIKWLEAAQSQGLDETYEGNIEVEASREKGNPNSVHQIKDWLFELGWKPITFDYKGDREIPQIRVEESGEKKLCPSVERLFKVEPALKAMAGLTVLTHRIGILNGYLGNVDEDGYVRAEIQGLTNTLRFKHKVVVNLPSVKKPYGDIVRGVLVAPEGYELCGSDMSSLEDRTKQHYMWKFDPDYVREMQTPDFDPHLNLAEFAGALTKEQCDSHKRKGKLAKDIAKAEEKGVDLKTLNEWKAQYEIEEDFTVIRHLYKTANYSCTYGAGGKKLALTLDIPESEGYDIVNAYRAKNWAIDAIAADQTIKFFYRQPDGSLTYKIYQGSDLLPSKEDSKMERRRKYSLSNKAESLWLWNPVSKLWYSLRFPKDIFSTLNQGTGVWCFDLWIKYFREKRPQMTGQMHDEVILCIKKGYRERCEKLLKDAIDSANEELNLNRELGIDVQFGDNYAEIH